MVSSRAVRGWRQMIVNQGFAATARTAWERLRTKRDRGSPAGHTAEDHPPGDSVHPFDRQHGVDTSGLIWGERLGSGQGNDTWNTAYYGIAPSVFRTVLERCELDYPDFTFVDMGSGKGRAVMLAASYPFREVLGVELSPELHAVAERNLGAFSAAGHVVCGGVRLLRVDAAAFRFPAGPLVLFFYHPFCKPVLKRVLRNLQRSLHDCPRKVYVLYINPELKRVLDSSPFLEKLWSETIHMEPEDQLADRVGSTTEESSVYRNRL